MNDPTLAGRERLREAYEGVPISQQSSVLSDMDVEDIPIRMVLYGAQELENWSHLVAARSLGKELSATITVPRPRDEES